MPNKEREKEKASFKMNLNKNETTFTQSQKTSLDLHFKTPKNSLNKSSSYKTLEFKNHFSIPKIKNISIPIIPNQNSKIPLIKKTIIGIDGFLVHQFSIPNGFVNLTRQNSVSKKRSNISFILNPKIRPERKGMVGNKLFASLKRRQNSLSNLNSHN